MLIQSTCTTTGSRRQLEQPPSAASHRLAVARADTHHSPTGMINASNSATTVLKLGWSERRGREPSRGAEGVEGVGRGHWGKGLGSGPCPLPRKFFDCLSKNGVLVTFGAFWVSLPRCM